MTVSVFKSTDSGAPVLTGQGVGGDLVKLLKQCLVNGYGAFATNTLTSNNTNVSDGDTVTVNGKVYTFRNTISLPYDVHIGVDADTSLGNFRKAINGTGTPGTDYHYSTAASQDVTCGAVTAHAVTLTAVLSGTGGNSMTLAKSAATLTVGGASFSGGTITKTAAGWTCAYQQNAIPVSIAASNTMQTAAATTSGSMTLPGSILGGGGEMLIMYVWTYDSVSGAATVTTPAGWTRIVDHAKFGRGPNWESLCVYTKVAVAADSSSVITLTSNASVAWQGFVQYYRSCDSVIPLFGGVQTAAGTTVNTPTVTALDDNDLAVSAAIVNSGASLAFTTPTGYTISTTANYVAGQNQLQTASKTISSAATGTLSWALSGAGAANTSYGVTLILKSNPNAQAVFKGGSGVQHYYHIDDTPGNGSNPQGKEAQVRGSEEASGFQAGVTHYFPTVAQIALLAGLTIRKSATSDTTARTWMVIADDRTVYVFIQTGDTASCYYTATFGEFYSILTGTDLYRSHLIARAINNNAAATTEQISFTMTQANSMGSGHYAARAYNALGGGIFMSKFSDFARQNAGHLGNIGLPLPNGADGNFHLGPVHLYENTVANCIRGRMRGMYCPYHNATAVADGDTIVGSGPYSGKTFLIVKTVANPGGANAALVFDITGPWETN